MPGLITHLTASDDPPYVPVSKPKKIAATILALGVLLVAAPIATAGNGGQHVPNPGWEVD